ncbi:hypothetical protein CALVIDRAFT_42185 [Calocera viscosa TUFC12733]|uniref:FMR1-interacting protein 1 conserved domain-containing protein n=1 Tax=Calocera viscosa (strain TUFC12733) TaxID=1330018 RepID=A0A167P3A1_CALVF|nr:hypothetical protein CALVIDRAFT_42185 [Calocera viscosa TUFC12733]
MRPVYPTTDWRQSSDRQGLLQQQHPYWRQEQQQHAHYQPITPAAVAALAMSSFSRSNASYSPHETYYGAGPPTNTLGYSISPTYVPSRDDVWQQPDRHQEPMRRPKEQHLRHSGHPRSFPQQHPEPATSGKKRKREDEPPIPVPGTGILLNTPEAIEAWIAERKARWPSAKRIEEKSAAKKVARERGEIKPDASRLPGGMRGGAVRGRVSHEGRRPFNVRGQQQRGRGRGRQGERHLEREVPGPQTLSAQSDPTITPNAAKSKELTTECDTSVRFLAPYSDPSSGTGDDSSDVDPVADAVSSKIEVGAASELYASPSLPDTVCHVLLHPTRIMRPKAAPSHSAPSTTGDLLRRLLSTEVRATVSRLSQAIRFLVDNEFLAGVEERVGEAETVSHVELLQTPDKNGGEDPGNMQLR